MLSGLSLGPGPESPGNDFKTVTSCASASIAGMSEPDEENKLRKPDSHETPNGQFWFPDRSYLALHEKRTARQRRNPVGRWPGLDFGGDILAGAQQVYTDEDAPGSAERQLRGRQGEDRGRQRLQNAKGGVESGEPASGDGEGGKAAGRSRRRTDPTPSHQTADRARYVISSAGVMRVSPPNAQNTSEVTPAAV